MTSLTPREQEVYALWRTGAPRARIAAQLSVTEETIKHHLKHIRAKLQLVGVPRCRVCPYRER